MYVLRDQQKRRLHMFISQARSPIGKSVCTRQGDAIASFVGNTGRFSLSRSRPLSGDE